MALRIGKQKKCIFKMKVYTSIQSKHSCKFSWISVYVGLQCLALECKPALMCGGKPDRLLNKTVAININTHTHNSDN